MRWLLALFLLLPTVAYAGWFSDDTYEECMLSKMKGQPPTMQHTAHKACARIFKMVEKIYFRDLEVGWRTKGYLVTVEIKKNESDYVVTKGEFKFAAKPCDEAKDSDFDRNVTMNFTNEIASEPLFGDTYQCMKSIEFWGTFR